MKKKVFMIAAIIALLSILAAGTLAYFTDDVLVHNVITSGSVDVDLVETMLEDGKEVPWENQEGVMPGQKVSKIVRVKNQKADAYIRVQVVTKVEGNLSTTPITIDYQNKGTYNTEKWILKDGWYYYKEAVKESATTEPLFDAVNFSGPGMDNTYQSKDITIEVSAQAVQVANNPIPAGGVPAVQGWPKK